MPVSIVVFVRISALMEFTKDCLDIVKWTGRIVPTVSDLNVKRTPFTVCPFALIMPFISNLIQIIWYSAILYGLQIYF